GRGDRVDVPRRALGLAAPRPRRPPPRGRGRAGRARGGRCGPGNSVEWSAVVNAHAEAAAHEHHHGPPTANQSSRVSPLVLGMLLFIASEAMLFGSFFAVLFFDRVVNPATTQWPPQPFEFPVFVAGVN